MCRVHPAGGVEKFTTLCPMNQNRASNLRLFRPQGEEQSAVQTKREKGRMSYEVGAS